MKQRLLYTGLLGALLSVGANPLYAEEVDSARVISYNVANTVPRATMPDPAALAKSFHTPESNVIDPIDEFSGRDWNGLTPLGTTVTQEMREARERVAAKADAEFEEIVRAGLY